MPKVIKILSPSSILSVPFRRPKPFPNILRARGFDNIHPLDGSRCDIVIKEAAFPEEGRERCLSFRVQSIDLPQLHNSAGQDWTGRTCFYGVKHCDSCLILHFSFFFLIVSDKSRFRMFSFLFNVYFLQLTWFNRYKNWLNLNALSFSGYYVMISWMVYESLKY